MGVSTKCFLAGGSRLDDVKDVLGLLMGCELAVARGTYRVIGVAASPLSMDTPEIARIHIPRSNVGQHTILYHFESSHAGMRSLTLPCSAYNIAVFAALAEFFGGFVLANDSDDMQRKFHFPNQSDINAGGGPNWDHLQERIRAVRPIRLEDIAQYEQYAVYKSPQPSPTPVE